VLPATTINISPNPSCNGAPVFFTTPAGMDSYYWTFGDTYFSYLQNPEHIYAAPGTYPVQLTAVTPQGCTIIKNGLVTIQPKPTVTLTIAPGTICPEGAASITATINANGNTMCPGFTAYSLQLYNNGSAYGAPIVPYTAPVSVNAYGNYSAVLTPLNPSCNCVLKTDTVLLKMFPKPVAKIKGKSTVCLSFGSGTINLENAVLSYSTYAWTANSPAVTFSPANTAITTAQVSAPGNYEIFLAVTDVNGCMAFDTLCIYATNSPAAFINPPSGTLCSGNIYPLQAVPTPAAAPTAGYSYLWNTTATTNSINASAAGVYYAYVTDMNTGCSATTNAITINKMPDISLFPSCCDTIFCGEPPINIQVPLPVETGQNVCSEYNIVWMDNGVPISPQPSPCNILNTATLVPLTGLHNISVAVTLNGCTDTSNVFNLFIENCTTCNCNQSDWGEITWQYNANVPKPNSIKCGDSLGAIDCKRPITINAIYNCADSSCTGAVNYSLTGAVTQSGSLPFTTNGLPQGSYMLTLYGVCGSDTCKKCEFPFEIKCVSPPGCDCKGSQWGVKTYSIGNITEPIKCMKPSDKPIDVKCNIPISIKANYNCAGEVCNGAVTYTLIQPSGTTTGNLPLTFTPNQVGIYTITMNGYCGTVLCDTCIIKFKVSKCDSIPPPICCPYNISVKDSIITTNSLASPPATIANATFAIGGPTGNLFTEIRANVVSYGLYDNFSSECINCKSYPYSWASVYKPGNVNIIPPAITMFNSTTTAFNPSGNGMYQNPREVVWASNAPFALPANINLSFLLPAPSIITCCELTAKICVKFTFRDKDCKECEVLVCFAVIIKPGSGSAGGGGNKDCTCDLKPMLNYEGGSKTLQCGDTLTLFQGNIPVSLQPNFTCKDGNGKACNSQPPTVTIKKNNGPATTLAGPLYNYTFLQSGLYQYSMVGLCAGKKCECKFVVKIP
jgi:PKD repeat protein